MSYLARLKALNPETLDDGEPSKPSKPPFEPFEGDPARCDPENTASVSDFAEQAAIIEEGAKVPAEWADGFAQLQARAIPPGVSPKEWIAMIDAAGRFLDRWGCNAAALGWSAGELFGLDSAAPMNRLDRRGAAFFLARAEVVAISAGEITIRVGDSVQRIQRRDGLAIPAWEASR